jgi:hypothetical protein
MSPLCQFGDDTALKGGLRSWPIAPEKRRLALEPILDPNAPTRALTLDDAEDGRPRQICTRHRPGTSPRGGSEGPKTRLMSPASSPGQTAHTGGARPEQKAAISVTAREVIGAWVGYDLPGGPRLASKN